MHVRSAGPARFLEHYVEEVVQRLGGGGYDDFVPGEVTKIAPSEDRTI